jgi:hypothetical protein
MQPCQFYLKENKVAHKSGWVQMMLVRLGIDMPEREDTTTGLFLGIRLSRFLNQKSQGVSRASIFPTFAAAFLWSK